jgi:NAD(P)-dependent dehydrogenase (short-subunit alcohol dehydrogenase family)
LDPQGKVAVVTGGNSGLGEAAAQALAKAGAAVVTFDLAGAAPAGATTAECDVTDPASVKAAVDEALAQHGRIDILVNNAGIGGVAPIATADGPIDLDAFRRIVEVNLIGATSVAGLVAHRMIANAPYGADGERGTIVNTCSIASFEGQEGMSAYTAAKSALAALTLVWARDLSRYGIRVNGVAPGLMDTPMVAGLPDAFKAELVKDCEFPKRAGRADEFGAVVEFLVRTPLINGEVIRFDAGTRPPARMSMAGY